MSTTNGANAAAKSFPSLKQLKEALPAHCFQSSVAVSLYYVAREVVFVSGLMWALHSFRASALSESVLLSVLVHVLYLFLQGTIYWGIFVLGHDCGHSSFSKHASLNWIVGNILHSYILCPYESWRITHCHHHKNTGSIENDEIFFPMRTDDSMSKDDKAQLTFARRLGYTLGVAWWVYLFYGFSPRNVPHFSLSPGLFKNRNHAVGASIGTIVAWLCLLGYLATVYGIGAVAIYHMGPCVVFSCWLVVTTFLHHNDEDTPWYDNSEWDYVKGNLSSIDRTYGVFDNIIHDIGTHQVHHLFPVIPHYHLREATRSFRKAFPEHVRVQSTSIIASFIKNIQLYAAYGTFEGAEGSRKVWSLREEKERSAKHAGDVPNGNGRQKKRE